jgi:hypothetical protein
MHENLTAEKIQLILLYIVVEKQIKETVEWEQVGLHLSPNN